MEEYNNNHNHNHLSENSGPSPSSRPNFLYHHQFPINNFHLQSGGSDHHNFLPDQSPPQQPPLPAAVKTEATTSQLLHTPIFHYPLMRGNLMHHSQQGGSGSPSSSEVEAIKAKILAHPQYSSLLEAYMDCQKVST